MQAQLDALQTEQPSVSSDGVPDGSANANVEHESLDTEANSRQNLEAEDPDQQLQQPHAEVVSLSDRCEALSVELQGARERVQSLQLECARSQSQYEALGTAVAGHLGLVRTFLDCAGTQAEGSQDHSHVGDVGRRKVCRLLWRGQSGPPDGPPLTLPSLLPSSEVPHAHLKRVHLC